MFGIAGTAELSTFCPGTRTWNRLQDGTVSAAAPPAPAGVTSASIPVVASAAAPFKPRIVVALDAGETLGASQWGAFQAIRDAATAKGFEVDLVTNSADVSRVASRLRSQEVHGNVGVPGAASKCEHDIGVDAPGLSALYGNNGVPAGSGLVGVPHQSGGSGVPLVASLVGLDNGNIAKMLPSVEQEARILMDSGFLPAGVTTGGLTCGRGADDVVEEVAFPEQCFLPEHYTGAFKVVRPIRQKQVVVDPVTKQVCVRTVTINLPRASGQLGDAELLKRIPNYLEWVRYELAYRESMIGAGFLAGEELKLYEEVFMPRMVRVAAMYMESGQHLLFLKYHRALLMEYFTENSRCLMRSKPFKLSWGSHDGELNKDLWSWHLALLNAARLSKPVWQPSGGRGGAPAGFGGAGRGAPAGFGGRGYGRPPGLNPRGRFDPQEVLHSLPAGVEPNSVCVPFWVHGACNRGPACPYAARGHVCLQCGNPSHGGGQCREGAR